MTAKVWGAGRRRRASKTKRKTTIDTGASWTLPNKATLRIPANLRVFVNGRLARAGALVRPGDCIEVLVLRKQS